MPVMDRDGVGISYEETGSGPAIVCTHGWGASAEMWRGQAEAFADAYRVVAWDMRGHGQSDSPPDDALYSRELTVEDLRTLLDQLGIQRAVIMGHSLGGYMSLTFALRHPERVRALVLQGCGPGYRNPSGRQQWNESRHERAKLIEERGFDYNEGGAEVRVSSHRSTQGLARSARGMLTQHDSFVIDHVAEIAVPTLLLVGEDDAPFRNAIDYMERKIAGAQKRIFAGAGHGANVEQPEEFNAELRAFLDALPPEG